MVGRRRCVLCALLVPLVAVAAARAADRPCVASAAAPRLDHVVVAVADLDSAAARFASLGFRLKRGRLHRNGLLNRHIKFRDGTGLELMTVAGPATDRMSRAYAALIAGGDGGACAALRVWSLEPVEAAARRLGLAPRRSSSGAWRFLGFEPGSGLGAVFFMEGGLPARDPDSLLAHADGSLGLAEAWVEAGPELVRLLEALGGRPCPDSVRVAGRAGRRLALGAGSLVVVAPSGTPGPRRLLGAALRTSTDSVRARPAAEVLPGFWLGYR